MVTGFSAKLDSGNVKVWGTYNSEYETEWKLLGGPVIGFHYKGIKGRPISDSDASSVVGSDLSFIVGDECRPKYFGARKLSVRLGEKRQVLFYWQESSEEYVSACRPNGFFYITDPEQLDWVEIFSHSATMYPRTENIFSTVDYLSLQYKHKIEILILEIFRLYNIPQQKTAVTDTDENLTGDGADYRGF